MADHVIFSPRFIGQAVQAGDVGKIVAAGEPGYLPVALLFSMGSILVDPFYF